MTRIVGVNDGPRISGMDLVRRAKVEKKRRKRKTEHLYAVSSADVELGSYGAKWRHGWVPLNPVATALKLKQLKAGGTHRQFSHAGHNIIVAPNHRGGYGALVVRGKTAHYAEHEHAGQAGRMARSLASRNERKSASVAKVQEAKVAKVDINSSDHPLLQRAALTAAERSDDMDDAYQAWKRAGGGPISNDIAQEALMKARQVKRVEGSFTDTASNGKQYDHNAVTGMVHRRDGALTGTMHQNADGTWKIEGVNGSLPAHNVKTRKQAINGLAVAHDLYLKDSAAKKAEEARKAESLKATTKTLADESFQRRQLIGKITESRYDQARIEREALLKGSHEAAMQHLNTLYKAKRAEDIKSAQRFRARHEAETRALFTIPKAPKPITKDTDRMQRARAELARRTGSTVDLNSTPDEATLDSIREGMPVEHGGRAGHVIGRYGQTFDTYHPPIAGGSTEVTHQGHRPPGQGFYMRHEIRMKRGRKQLVSTFAGWSAAKAS